MFANAGRGWGVQTLGILEGSVRDIDRARPADVIGLFAGMLDSLVWRFDDEGVQIPASLTSATAPASALGGGAPAILRIDGELVLGASWDFQGLTAIGTLHQESWVIALVPTRAKLELVAASTWIKSGTKSS